MRAWSVFHGFNSTHFRFLETVWMPSRMTQYDVIRELSVTDFRDVPLANLLVVPCETDNKAASTLH